MKRFGSTKWFAMALALAIIGTSSVAMADEDPDDVDEEAVEDSEPLDADEPAADEDVDEESADEAADDSEPLDADEPAADDEVADDSEPLDTDEAADDEAADDEVADDSEPLDADEPAADDDEVADDSEPLDTDEAADDDAPSDEVDGGLEVADDSEPLDADEEAADEEEDDLWGDVDAGIEAVEEAEEGAEATIVEEPFAPTFAFGVETGRFFTDLERFNSNALAPNDAGQFDVSGTYHVDLVAESRVIENLRVSILGGTTFARHSDPSIFGWYVGAEPAYVTGDGGWEMALGLTAGVGGLRITDGNDELATSLTILRPFLEARRNLSEMTSTYVRAGFNAWYPRNPRSEDYELESTTGHDLSTRHLESGGLYISVGARFGAVEGLTQRTPEEIDDTEVQEVPDDDLDGSYETP